MRTNNKNNTTAVDTSKTKVNGYNQYSIFQNSALYEQDPNRLYLTIKKDSNSTQANLIYSDEKLFEKVTPTQWISLAKSDLFIFGKILKSSKLAIWANQFPSKVNKGLLMIATFTRQHATLALEFGKEALQPKDLKIINTGLNEGMYPNASNIGVKSYLNT